MLGEIEVLALLPETPPDLTEQALHARFRRLRTHGEWFVYGKDLAALVRSLPPLPVEFPYLIHARMYA